MKLTLPENNPWLANKDSLGGITIIDHLFKRLDALYPSKFTSQFRNEQHLEDTKAMWAEYLQEDGVELGDIKIGLDRCRKKLAWPPSYTEFLQHCKNKASYFDTFNEAVTQLNKRGFSEDEWSETAIYWAAIEIGEFDMMRSKFTEMKTRWESVLDKHRDNKETQPIPKAPKRIQHIKNEDKSINRDVGNAALKNLREMMVGINKNSKVLV